MLIADSTIVEMREFNKIEMFYDGCLFFVIELLWIFSLSKQCASVVFAMQTILAMPFVVENIYLETGPAVN